MRTGYPANNLKSKISSACLPATINCEYSILQWSDPHHWPNSEFELSFRSTSDLEQHFVLYVKIMIQRNFLNRKLACFFLLLFAWTFSLHAMMGFYYDRIRYIFLSKKSKILIRTGTQMTWIYTTQHWWSERIWFYQRWARVPVGLGVPCARVPQFFLRVLGSRVPVQNVFFAFPHALAFLFRVPMLMQLRLNYATIGGGGGVLVSSECRHLGVLR